jgi:hypothetical protein
MNRESVLRLVYLIVHRFYTIAITPSRNKYIRTLALTPVVILFSLRAYKLWLRPVFLISITSALAITSAGFGLPLALFLFLCIPYLAMIYVVHTHPDDGIGHRVGFEGYTGTHIENTTHAVRALAAADSAGEYTRDRIPDVHFPFIEFDVRETKDGELVLFHDFELKRAFPLDEELEEENNYRNGRDDDRKNIFNINNKPWRDLAEQGIDWHTASIEDLTLDQLRTLHLGGREGQHPPTLEEFLAYVSLYFPP